MVLVSCQHPRHTKCALKGEVVKNSCWRIFFKGQKKNTFRNVFL